jgi:hypothetical protein
MKTDTLDRWIPIRVAGFEDVPYVDWFYTGDAELDGSNLADIVRRSMSRPFNYALRKRTLLDDLGEYVDAISAGPPAGLVFHMSRCGSTLVSRMLSAITGTLVVAEAGAIENVLRAHLKNPEIDDERRVAWLRWIVAAIGMTDRRRERYVLKLDSWQTGDLALFERAFPGVPWTYVYRDPIEVLVSHLRGISYMMAAGNAPALLGIPVTDAIRIPRLEYCERALLHIGEAVLAHGVSAAQLVEYSELPQAVWTQIAPAFGLAVSPGDLAAMRAIASIDAKRPDQPFRDDRDAKHQEATAQVREAAARRLEPLHAALERVRVN